MIRLSCAAALGLLTACTGLEPAALSAGATVAHSGVTLMGRGKAQVIRLATFEESKSATERAAARLGLSHKSGRSDGDFWRRTYIDDRGQLVSVEIKCRTATLTQLKTDVGIFGPDALAVFVLEEIVEDLPHH